MPPYRLAAVLMLAALPSAAMASPPTVAEREEVVHAAIQRGEPLWRQLSRDELRSTLTCRWLAGYALTLCEAHAHPERLEKLLALARRMQDQDPRSRQWGNLRWYWRDERVTDPNAVEFVMHDALLIHLRHRDWLPEAARKELAALLRLGVEGCLRHRAPTEYTNIAILNAGNLIVLGEQLRRTDAATEGYRRLDALCALTAVLGVHEFCSPTYYGTDLNGLLMIRCHAAGQRQQKQSEALLKLFWTDIAANWFPAARRLGGSHSRSYDYLRGLGALDWHLWANGWLESASPGSAERVEPWAEQWRPPQPVTALAGQLPRVVRQHWGFLPAEARTQMICPDIALSCCGAGYGNQDSTLAVDLPGREGPRCYFIADGRGDPYGKAKIEAGAARHMKSLHLQPFWAGAQRERDALGLVVYRPSDVADSDLARVQSHFVLRRPDAIWREGKPLVMTKGTAANPAEARFVGHIVLRYGSAALGIMLPWAQTSPTGPVAVRLVDDGNTWGCIRASVDHGHRSGIAKGRVGSPIGAAILVRVGSGLETDAAFDAWRREFDKVGCQINCSEKRIELALTDKDRPLSIAVEGPWDYPSRVHFVPQPYQGVLEIDGREVGRPLLTAVEPLASVPPGTGPTNCARVPPREAVYWEAESGLILPGLDVCEDTAASGGRYIEQESSAIGQPSGIALWTLEIEKPGRYWLWGRVRSHDASRGKFEFRAIGEDGPLLRPIEWLPRSPGEWQWKPLGISGQTSPLPLDLPRGQCRILLQVRQSGAQLDRLMLTDDPEKLPE